MTIKVLGIWMDLDWRFKYSTILVFKVIFVRQKSAKSLTFFFIEDSIKIGEQLLLLTYFDNCSL